MSGAVVDGGGDKRQEKRGETLYRHEAWHSWAVQ